jgi:hypothetical protein
VQHCGGYMQTSKRLKTWISGLRAQRGTHIATHPVTTFYCYFLTRAAI